MMNFWWLLIGKDIQMTYHYIFYEINIVFNTIVDVRVTPNPALDELFLLSYWRQLLWTFQDFLYNRQANTSFIFQSIDRMSFLCVQIAVKKKRLPCLSLYYNCTLNYTLRRAVFIVSCTRFRINPLSMVECSFMN